ncbi:MAG: hypothetical protein H7832_06365 [Magnetococcus sp. DMHC-6]
MKFIKAIPLTAYLLLFFNVIVYISQSRPDINLQVTAFAFTLQSGTHFAASVGDVLLMFGVLFLYVEIFKATRSSPASILDHFLSMLVFVGFLIEFLLVSWAATPLFLLLALMAFLDVVAGFTVTISTARRDFSRD